MKNKNSSENPFVPDPEQASESALPNNEAKDELHLKKEKLSQGIDKMISAVQKSAEQNIKMRVSFNGLISPESNENYETSLDNTLTKQSFLNYLQLLKTQLLKAESIALVDFTEEENGDGQEYILNLVDIKLPFRRRNFYDNVVNSDTIAYFSIEYNSEDNSFHHNEEPDLSKKINDLKTFKTLQKKDIGSYDKMAAEYYDMAIEGNEEKQIDFLQKDILSYKAAEALYKALLNRYILLMKQEQSAEAEAVFILQIQQAFQRVVGHEQAMLSDIVEAAFSDNSEDKQKVRRFIKDNNLADYNDLCKKKDRSRRNNCGDHYPESKIS